VIEGKIPRAQAETMSFAASVLVPRAAPAAALAVLHVFAEVPEHKRSLLPPVVGTEHVWSRPQRALQLLCAMQPWMRCGPAWRRRM
jgi:hypothetical protein